MVSVNRQRRLERSLVGYRDQLLCSTIVEHQSSTDFSVRSFVRSFVRVCHTCSSVFSNVYHATQNSPMYVTPPSFLRCMSHSPEFSDVCHTAQNFPMYVTPPGFLRGMSHSPEFSNVGHTTQFSPMYVTPLSFL